MAHPELHVQPDLAVMDEPIEVVLTGVPPNAAVTVSCSSYVNGTLFYSYGHFYADDTGCVKVHEQVRVLN